MGIVFWSAMAEAGGWTFEPKSSLRAAKIKQQLEAEGAVCGAPSVDGDGAFRCVFLAGTFADYPKRVSVIVPLQLTEVKQIGIHFHGHLVGEGSSYDRVMAQFRFEQGLIEAGRRDMILIVPESEGRCDTFKAYFAENQNFVEFYGKMEGWLELGVETQSLTLFLLTHSGGYVAIESLLRQALDPSHPASRIRKVALLDASYTSRTEHWANWVQSGQGEAIWIYFMPNSQTHRGADRLVRSFFPGQNIRSPLARFHPSKTWVRSQGIADTHFGLAYRCWVPTLAGKPCFSQN